MPEYINHRLYFTKKEENCIRLLMIEADRETYEILYISTFIKRYAIKIYYSKKPGIYITFKMNIDK